MVRLVILVQVQPVDGESRSIVIPEDYEFKLFPEMRGKSSQYRKLSQVSRGSQGKPWLPVSQFTRTGRVGWQKLLSCLLLSV